MRPTTPLGLALAATLAWIPADGRFPVRSTDPPQRQMSTLERLALPRLEAVHRDVAALAARRRDLPPLPGLNDYRSILHAHAEDSVHTGGTRPEMLADAHRAGVQAILLTDHFRPPRDFMDSWRGLKEGVLFIPGSEARGFLVYPAASILDRMGLPAAELVPHVTTNAGMAFLSHLEERPDHPMDGLTGTEIYNRHWDAKKDRATLIALALKLTHPAEVRILAEALERFPDETLGAQIDYPEDYLAIWDAGCRTGRLTGVAANDCHHNQVFLVKVVDADTVLLGTNIDPDEKMQRVSALVRPGIRELTRGRKPGDVVVRLDFDPYHRSFRNVSTHILAPELTEPALRAALHAGRAYLAHDWMADPTGFHFGVRERGASPDGAPVASMGEEVTLRPGLVLSARFPVACSRIRLIRDGGQVGLGRGDLFDFPLESPGVYRLEGWLRLDAEERCWILSNPVYVRGAAR